MISLCFNFFAATWTVFLSRKYDCSVVSLFFSLEGQKEQIVEEGIKVNTKEENKESRVVAKEAGIFHQKQQVRCCVRRNR